MSPSARGAAVVLALAAAGAGSARAQSSSFGISGLGLPGRAVTARNAGMAGALGALDPSGAVNPAALGRWRGLAGWAVGAPSYRRFDGRDGDASLRATRFPLFGFASLVRPRLALGVTLGDYLDRTWSVTRQDSVVLGSGDTVGYIDGAQSLGGVSDLRLAAAYRYSDRVSFGAALHTFAGSTRLTVQRDFDSTVYQDYLDLSNTDFSGLGLSLGILATVAPRLDVGVALRASGRLTATNSGGPVATVRMPMELTVSAAYQPVGGVSLAGTVQRAGWARSAEDLVAAGQAASRSTWSAAVGLELERTSLLVARAPLRLGYRWRQLPTPIGGADLSEHAVSGGLGLNFAQNRTVLDLSYESGTRRAADLKESFQTIFLGVTVRP